jgi:hypothetical protein
MEWPKKFSGGSPLEVWLNKLLDAARNCEIKPGLGYKIKSKTGSNGFVLEIADGEETRLKLYRVKDDLGACLRCRSWDGTNEGSDDTYIAKRPEVRNQLRTGATAPWTETKDGVTYTYTFAQVPDTTLTPTFNYCVRTVAGSDSSSETDDITPPYLFNSEIYAENIPPITFDTAGVNGGTTTCYLMDTSGREWGERV